MHQSILIIEQCLNKIQEGAIKIDNNKFFSVNKVEMKYYMENLINHFKTYTEGFSCKENWQSISIEAPKGETGITIFSNNTNKLIRCHIKSPGLINLQALNFMVKGHSLADLVAIIGTQDLVFGEVDR